MHRYGLRGLAGLLLYGDTASVDRLAHDLVAANDPVLWELLVGTIRSDDDLSVQVRCLEVLARATAVGGNETARQILAALGAAASHRPPADEGRGRD